MEYRELSREELENGELRFALELICSDRPALGVSFRLADAEGNPVLPAFYSDNYLMMMPGDRMSVTVTVSEDRMPVQSAWTLNGWNVSDQIQPFQGDGK